MKHILLLVLFFCFIIGCDNQVIKPDEIKPAKLEPYGVIQVWYSQYTNMRYYMAKFMVRNTGDEIAYYPRAYYSLINKQGYQVTGIVEYIHETITELHPNDSCQLISAWGDYYGIGTTDTTIVFMRIELQPGGYVIIKDLS